MEIPHATALSASVSGHDAADQARFTAAQVAIQGEWDRYLAMAPAHQLFALLACNYGDEDQAILGGLTKKDLVDLYTNHMANQDAVGRTLYNRIKQLAPLSICPYCCFGHVATLDHFLGKSRYPAFSVMPANLVPSCRDCNTGKYAGVITQAEQILHPYFEDEAVERDGWLFGEIVEGSPATIRYFAQPPPGWPADRASRLTNSFKDFNLAERFGVQAGPELATLGSRLQDLQTPGLRFAHLRDAATTERRIQRNSWKTVLYEAAHNSAWYWAEGFRAPTTVFRPV